MQEVWAGTQESPGPQVFPGDFDMIQCFPRCILLTSSYAGSISKGRGQLALSVGETSLVIEETKTWGVFSIARAWPVTLASCLANAIGHQGNPAKKG